MEKSEIIARLKEIVTPYSKDTNALANINEESNFISDLKINSANLVDIVLDVEEAFDIEIDNDAMEKMLTVGASIDIVQNKLAAHDGQ
jgi:acyl carrier protein